MKAIALFSGGLDSTLAMKLVIDQGVEVLACNIHTGFGATKEREAHMRSMCDQVGAKLRIVDIRSEYLRDVLFTPKHGYGKHFNPCIDCHAKMFAVAKRLMDEEGASFLISGEVLGQRPMSQNGEALERVLAEGDVDGLLLRPLSAKALKPTIAEERGWVDRDRLEGIVGRNRERQMELAQHYGLRDFETPGGGCLLTDEHFARRMRDFIAHDTFDIDDIPVVKYGRQLRLPEGAKLVIGRNQEENAKILTIRNDKYLSISVAPLMGPDSLLSANATQADRLLAARLILTYCKTSDQSTYPLTIGSERIEASPFPSREGFERYFV
ncbi:MAG: 7-cyano-7-deazaguanine synthase [Campylobacterales bacterium]|nr:7-cyano-7-deazaguanine synthase [Campylobacterales bacterium]